MYPGLAKTKTKKQKTKKKTKKQKKQKQKTEKKMGIIISYPHMIINKILYSAYHMSPYLLQVQRTDDTSLQVNYFQPVAGFCYKWGKVDENRNASSEHVRFTFTNQLPLQPSIAAIYSH